VSRKNNLGRSGVSCVAVTFCAAKRRRFNPACFVHATAGKVRTRKLRNGQRTEFFPEDFWCVLTISFTRQAPNVKLFLEVEPGDLTEVTVRTNSQWPYNLHPALRVCLSGLQVGATGYLAYEMSGLAAKTAIGVRAKFFSPFSTSSNVPLALLLIPDRALPIYAFILLFVILVYLWPFIERCYHALLLRTYGHPFLFDVRKRE
jgi:hypothetical protein